MLANALHRLQAYEAVIYLRKLLKFNTSRRCYHLFTLFSLDLANNLCLFIYGMLILASIAAEASEAIQSASCGTAAGWLRGLASVVSSDCSIKGGAMLHGACLDVVQATVLIPAPPRVGCHARLCPPTFRVFG